MCKSRRDAVVTNPKPSPQRTTPKSSSSGTNATATTSSSFSAGNPSSTKPSTSSTSSSLVSPSSLKDSLPDNPTLYPFSEICSATNNFLSRRLSTFSSSSCWRCTLRGKDTAVFQHRFRGDPAGLRRRLASTCKIHHSSIVRLIGASIAGDYIYLVYDYVPGANLADCLRNPRNPNYTPLDTWLSRMRVAKDIADGLAYIHYYATGGNAPPSGPSSDPRRRGPVHNRIKSSSVIITEPQLRAKICHVGAAGLSGEITDDEEVASADDDNPNTEEISEISEVSSHVPLELGISDSFGMKIQGTRVYMAPEILSSGSISQKSDVYAFGVVLLELLSGEEPVKYKFDREKKNYTSVSLVGLASTVMGSKEEEEMHRRIRRWVDRRLRDSFPVTVAEKMLRLALECVEPETAKRPEMERVAGKVSRMLLESEKWAEKMKVPTEFTVSMAPR